MSQRPDPVAGRERFKDHAGARTHIQGIDLDPGGPAQTPRTAWVCARRKAVAAAPAGIRELRCAAVRPARREAGDEGESDPAGKWKSPPAGGAAEWPACLCPSRETATAKSKPCFYGKRPSRTPYPARTRGRRSSRVVKSYGSYPLPPAIKGLARDPEMRGRAEPRSPCCPTNPSRLSAPAPSGLTPLPLRPTTPSEVAFLPEFAC